MVIVHETYLLAWSTVNIEFDYWKVLRATVKLHLMPTDSVILLMKKYIRTKNE